MEDKRLREEFNYWVINTNKSIAELRETIEYDFQLIKDLRDYIEELEDKIRKDRIMFAMKDRSMFM